MHSRKAQIACAWCGPGLVVLMLVGLLLAQFIPWGWQPSPAASADEIAAMYDENLTAIRVGMVFCMMAGAFILPWGALIAMRTFRIEGGFQGGFPLWTTVQVACLGGAGVIGTIFGVFWAAAAFRVGDPGVSNDTIRVLNDIGWFFFLLPVAPFVFWNIAIAIPILSARNEPAVLPRWVGYVNLVDALSLMLVFFTIFVKEGALNWRGLIGLYIPLAIFCAWMLVMTYALIKSVKHDEQPVTISSAPRVDVPVGSMSA